MADDDAKRVTAVQDGVRAALAAAETAVKRLHEDLGPDPVSEDMAQRAAERWGQMGQAVAAQLNLVRKLTRHPRAAALQAEVVADLEAAGIRARVAPPPPQPMRPA